MNGFISKNEIPIAICRILLGTVLLLVGSLSAAAQCNVVQTKLLPNDGAAGDIFGRVVAISGTTAIVGAPRNDDNVNGEDSGSAYLFEVSTGQQIANLVPDDGEAGDNFGRSVGISGDTAIVGAPYDDDNGIDSGSAYVFDLTDLEHPQHVKLLPDDGAAGDTFGQSVAISGTTAIVGHPWDDVNGTNSGSAYLFDVTTGEQTAKLLPGDAWEGDNFGWSVAISEDGTTAIVGAYHKHVGRFGNAGAAYLFNITDLDNPQQIAVLLPNDGSPRDSFGSSVAISGTTASGMTAIVGAYGDEDNGDYSGSAYLFDVTDPSNPQQTAKLLPFGGNASDHFGNSVSISGTTAIVGAKSDDNQNGDNAGAAYLFDTISGQQTAYILADDGALGDLFGSVAISGTTAIVGALYDDDKGEDSGAAYLFEISCDPVGKVYSSVDTPVEIRNLKTVTSSIFVEDDVTIADLDVTLFIEHDRVSDLDVFLIAPNDTRVELLTDVGGLGQDFIGTTLDDESEFAVVGGAAPFTGTFQPEGSLSDFDGMSTQGEWTLEVTDDSQHCVGTILHWYFEVAIQDPVPGISVNPTDGLVTTEGGDTDTFDVVLDSEPSADVTIGISSSNTAEGTVDQANLTFTTLNWDIPQTVTVTGVNDVIKDGDVAYSIVTAAATSSDSGYNGLDAENVAVTNEDDDSPPGGGSETYSASDTPINIPDRGTILSTIDVPDDFGIINMTVNLNISHQRLSDLRVTLIGPDNTEVTLSNFNGDNNVSAFNNSGSRDVWTLEVRDVKNRKTGTLNDWSISIDY